jgi:Tfp pilus assembly protein PilV
MRQDPGPAAGQAGFAAVDALVAVTILSLSLALSLTAAQAGVRASRAAAETRDAELILRDHLEQTAGRVGVWTGRDESLTWRVEAQAAETARGGQAGPCLRIGSAKAVRTGRAYRIATADACLAETDPAQPPAPGPGA